MHSDSMRQNPYAPPPVFPRPWLPLPAGVYVGSPKGTPSPNPYGINWPKAQFANPSMLPFSTGVRLANQKPARRKPQEAPIFWPRGQFVPAIPQDFQLYLGATDSPSAYEESRETWKKMAKAVLAFSFGGAVLKLWWDAEKADSLEPELPKAWR